MKTVSVEKVNMKDGTYDGIWGGYEVKILKNGLWFRVQDGIRTMGAPCEIVVIKKKAFVSLKG